MGIQSKEEWSEEKTRNETDIIKTRITRMIEQDLRDDPYAQQVFSELLKKAIAQAEAMFEHPLKQYMLFVEFEEKVAERKIDDMPDFGDNKHAQAYFGVFRKIAPQMFAGGTAQDSQYWIDLAQRVDDKVTDAVAEHSINPQNIEAEIRKGLLPELFKACKKEGLGMDQAKTMLETIIQITRVGLSAL
jgi:type I restriction enzyme R subunit